MSTAAVTTERRDGVLIVHLDDGKANALSFDMITAISVALDEAEGDDEIRAMVLHGRPGKFSAGFDLGVMFGDDMSAIINLVADGGALVHRLYGSSLPVVAASTGHALAAGALVLLGCDVRVGGDIEAKVGLNEVAIKMVLPDWALTIATDRLSKRHLQRALANARITTPRDAVDVGFLDEVVPDGEELDRAIVLAAELAATLDPSAYARTVRAIRGPVLDLMAEQIASDRSAGISPLSEVGRVADMAIPNVNPKMEYRRLGNTGLQVSVLSFGSWVTFDTQLDNQLALECMAAAGDAGCNFFDNAEAYAGGKSETIMGEVLRELAWPRWSYVVTTKVFWGLNKNTPNMNNTLNRKYMMHAIDGSLERFGLDFVDVLYCHRSDPNTPIEETVWAMSDIISAGKALYWGTSEWSADEIRAAIDIADRHHLHRPVTEQSQYNILERKKVEKEYARINAEFNYGNTIWSPLASGLLTGKYKDGIPEDSRAALEGYGWLAGRLSDAEAIARVEKLRPIADRLDCTMAQLALAWCTKNPHVSSVITGASKVSQVEQNFGALDVIPLLTDEVKEEMEAAVNH